MMSLLKDEVEVRNTILQPGSAGFNQRDIASVCNQMCLSPPGMSVRQMKKLIVVFIIRFEMFLPKSLCIALWCAVSTPTQLCS